MSKPFQGRNAAQSGRHSSAQATREVPSRLRVLIYRDQLLPLSQTFVRSQGEALARYEAVYVGSNRTPGLELPEHRVVTINPSSRRSVLREAAFKLCGYDREFIGRIRPFAADLVHAHFGPDGVYAMPLARRLGIPLVVTFHGFDATVKKAFVGQSYWGHRLFARRRSALMERAHGFIAVSRYIADALIAQGYPESKIVVHYIGVDCEVFRPAAGVAREPVVLFVGRLVEKKGCEYLIRSMARVQANHSHARLVVIGEGPLRADLEALAGQVGVRCSFLGAQPPAVVKEWMNRASVFCVPSIVARSGNAEAFGIVFAEAQAMGLPVVSFVSGGVPEAVADGETGYLAPQGDWEALGERIDALFRDEECRIRFGLAGRERVVRHFNLRSQTAKLEDLYDSVVRSYRGDRLEGIYTS